MTFENGLSMTTAYFVAQQKSAPMTEGVRCS